MQLRRVRVTNYKSALDSDWFEIASLTCLVGKNESGKTALLEALEKLNSVDADRADFHDTDYPRLYWSEYRQSDKVDDAVSTEWTLDAEEVAHVNEIAAIPAVEIEHRVLLSKNYDNKLIWTLNIPIEDVARGLIDRSGLTPDEREQFKSITLTDQLIKGLTAIAERSVRQEAFLSELKERFPKGSLTAEIGSYLQSRLPHFLYYSQYDRLPGQIAVDELVRARAQGNLENSAGFKIFIALLSMVGTSPEEIQKISTSEQLIAQLEAVENRLSNRIFKYWTQNKHLEVNFRFDSASPNDPPPFNSGKIFRTRIRNNRHKATIGLDERSTGFIWFFSFLVWFSEVQREFGENLFILLDEPGLSLHARAQADLLRFIKEELVTSYPVMYSTHSPFMIDPADLLSCRTVEDATSKDDEILGTKVGGDVLSTDNDTLFPLQAALGYDLTQTLFVGEHCLLVEGPSDLLFLRWFSSELQKRKRIGLDPRWTVTPCEGLTKVSSFMSLFGGNRLHVAVFTDYAHGEKRKVREMRESALLREGHVFTPDMYLDQEEADIEDMIGRPMYLEIVRRAYNLTAKQALPKSKQAASTVRVTSDVKEHFLTLPPEVPNYDHFKPAQVLVSMTDADMLTGLDEAIDRFEALFKDLNALI